MACGIPQGPVLGPFLFNLYKLPQGLILRNNIDYHSYADDTQIYLAVSPDDYSLLDCVSEKVNNWMSQNCLQIIIKDLINLMKIIVNKM